MKPEVLDYLSYAAYTYVRSEVQGFAARSNYQQICADVHVTGLRNSDYHSGAYRKLSVPIRR